MLGEYVSVIIVWVQGPTACITRPYKKDKDTEEKAKVVAAGWGTEFVQFLAALAVLHQDER